MTSHKLQMTRYGRSWRSISTNRPVSVIETRQPLERNVDPSGLRENGMSDAALPTHADVRALVYDWYRKLDVHAPVEEYLPLLADNGAKLVFPEATLEGKDGFVAWYQGGSEKLKLPGVINLFFNEVHELKSLEVTISGDDSENWRADVLIVVKWEAHRWEAPKATSDYIAFDAFQRWTVRASHTGKPVIQEYIVDALEKLQRSVDL